MASHNNALSEAPTAEDTNSATVQWRSRDISSRDISSRDISSRDISSRDISSSSRDISSSRDFSSSSRVTSNCSTTSKNMVTMPLPSSPLPRGSMSTVRMFKKTATPHNSPRHRWSTHETTQHQTITRSEAFAEPQWYYSSPPQSLIPPPPSVWVTATSQEDQDDWPTSLDTSLDSSFCATLDSCFGEEDTKEQELRGDLTSRILEVGSDVTSRLTDLKIEEREHESRRIDVTSRLLEFDLEKEQEEEDVRIDVTSDMLASLLLKDDDCESGIGSEDSGVMEDIDDAESGIGSEDDQGIEDQEEDGGKEVNRREVEKTSDDLDSEGDDIDSDDWEVEVSERDTESVGHDHKFSDVYFVKEKKRRGEAGDVLKNIPNHIGCKAKPVKEGSVLLKDILSSL